MKISAPVVVDPLASTFSPEEAVKTLNSGKWYISGSKAFLKREYGLKKDEFVTLPDVSGASLESGMIIIMTKGKDFRFHCTQAKIDRPSSGVVTIGVITEVNEEKKLKDGGGHRIVRIVGQIATIKKRP